MRALVLVAVLATACSYDHPARLYADAPGGTCDQNTCDVNAICMATPGGNPKCTCVNGYTGDGFRCTATWAFVMGVPNLSLGPPYELTIGAAGSQIYIAPNSGNTGTYFKSIDIANMSVADETPPTTQPSGQNEFCSCGYHEVFVQFDARFFMFGNYGAFYDTSQRVWSDVPAYAAASARRDAAAITANSRVYLLGGGDTDKRSVEYYDPSADTFTTDGTQLPFDLDGGNAVAISTIVYATGWNTKSIAVRDVGGPFTPWQSLPDAPQLLGVTAAVLGTKIIVPQQIMSAPMCVYDTGTSAWSCNLASPAGLSNVVVVSVAGNVYALGDTTSGGISVYRLMTVP